MKILTTAWNVFERNDTGYCISRNGGSVMIHDICEYIGRKEMSYLFVGSIPVNELVFGNIRVLDNQKYLPNHRDRTNIEEWHSGLQRRFREVLTELNPDYVLVQGGIDFSGNCMKVLIEKEVPFSFVDHLYSGKKQTEYNDKLVSEWEEQIFSLYKPSVIAVGNAMKKDICRDYPFLDSVVAIPNGTSYVGELCKSELKNQYHINKKKVLLCSGSLHPRKNQLQLVRAYARLSEEYKKNICIVICGKDSVKKPTKDELIFEIRKHGLENSIIYMGSFPKDEMKKVYSIVDGLVMPSLSEGLSLVALEMITYGKPVIMFSDNETAGDVNDEKVVVLANEHSDQALAESIVEWYEKDWDEGYIKEYSKYYNMERVADDYIKYCRDRIECE